MAIIATNTIVIHSSCINLLFPAINTKAVSQVIHCLSHARLVFRKHTRSHNISVEGTDSEQTLRMGSDDTRMICGMHYYMKEMLNLVPKKKLNHTPTKWPNCFFFLLTNLWHTLQLHTALTLSSLVSTVSKNIS